MVRSRIDPNSPFGTMHGRATVSPAQPVVAGSYGSWLITFRAGRAGVDDGGRIRVTFRIDGDWAIPQLTDPSAPNYVTVSTNGAARVTASYDHRGHIRPWSKALTVLVDDGYLAEGDEIAVVLGDRSGGSPGFEVQAFVEPRSQFKVFADLGGTGRYIALEDLAPIPVVSGIAASLVAIVPTDVTLEETFRLSIVARDEWGNVADDYVGSILLEGDPALHALPTSVSIGPNDSGGCVVGGLRAPDPGVYRIHVRDIESSLAATSNPITVHSSQPGTIRYWGDLHGQSGETCGTGTVDEYFAFARDKAHLDFCGTQGNDFEMDSVGWKATVRAVAKYNEPGRFVAFLGYEWSGNTGAGGDHNVNYLSDGAPILRSGHWLLDDTSDISNDCGTIDDLYAAFRLRDDVFLVPHVGGRFADLDRHDPDLEPLVEIYSTHGEFEWMLTEALNRGYRVGVSCSSDDHTGRPGLTSPTRTMFAVKGGLLCVLSSDLSREGLARAIRSRACYGTTGERIGLQVSVDGVSFGGEVTVDNDAAVVHVTANGTGDIERIELRSAQGTVTSWPTAVETKIDGSRVRIRWTGARNRGRNRAADWSGTATVEGTTIVSCTPYSFDRRSEGVILQSPTEVRWESSTCGDADGIVLELEPADSGLLHVKTAQGELEVDLKMLGAYPLTKAFGGLGLQLMAERLPLGVGPDVEVDISVDTLSTQGTAFYVVVRQVDGAKAWSSPIWIKRL